MWPVLVDWHGTVIYTYPLFIGLSWGVGFRLSESRLPSSIPFKMFCLWMVGLFISSWLGAKFLFILTQDRWATSELLTASSFWLGGGFVFLGGFLGGGLYGLLAGTLNPKLHSSRMNFIIIPLLWAHALGRVGCFLAGCCYGTESHVPWAIHLHGVQRHPTQLYEAFGLVLLAWLLEKKSASWRLLPAYLVGYGLLRLGVEIFRGDELRGAWLGLSTSQWIAFGLIMVGVGLFTRGNSSKSDKSYQ